MYLIFFRVLTFEIEVTCGNMETLKFEIHVNMKSLMKLKWEKKQILEAPHNVYDDSASSQVIVYDWIRHSRKGEKALKTTPAVVGRQSQSLMRKSMPFML